MKSRTSPRFRELYKALSASVRRDARNAYVAWQAAPQTDALQFKEIKLRKNKSIWSVRISLGWRAVGLKPAEDEIVWVWIGSHADYDRLIESMRKERGGNPM